MVSEWDALADRRRSEIGAGLDVSFWGTLLPAVKQEVSSARSRFGRFDLLDVGCGTGELTAALAPLVDTLVGIDPSERSIELARAYAPDVALECSDLEEFAQRGHHRFAISVANMVLMNVADLDSFLVNIVRMLRPEGRFIATLTHPWTWPKYWSYEEAPWFNYESELFIQAPWKVSGAEVAAIEASTHVHRPLARYVNAFARAGLAIRGLRELGRTTHTRDGVEVGRPFPRFLLVTADRGLE